LSRQAEGSGIGLSLVKKLVEALGGSISLKSKVGSGSTFTIRIPNKKALEKESNKQMINLIDNNIVEAVDIEFADIYL
jgi:chemotaxis protein histidine kinase CheA